MSIFVKMITVVIFFVLTSVAVQAAEEEFDLFGVAEKIGVLLLEQGTIEDVETVQEVMYNLGYDVTVDGNHGPKTSKAIRLFQKMRNETITGALTLEQWRALQATKVPESWGALSVSMDGKFGEAHSKGTRALAEQIAERRCRRYTKKECIVVSVYDYGWIVAGWCRSGNLQIAVLGAGGTGSDSRSKAFAEADAAVLKAGLNPYNGKDCFKTVALHAKYGYEHTLTEREGFEVEHQADGLLVDVPK